MQVGMIFALVFAVIMIGLIFVFALPMIGDLMNVGGQAQINKMIKDIETKIDNLYWNAGYGSSEVLKISLPADTRICFINPDDLSNAIYKEKWRIWSQDEAIKVMIRNEEYNLWYYYGEDQNGYKVNHLLVSGKNFCTISGTEIYLENTGKQVSVSLMD